MKETFYFTHDYNPRTDPKIKRLIQKHGYLGYGLFWAIVEDLYNNANALQTDYESIAFDLRTQCETIKSIIEDFALFEFENDGQTFYSNSINRRIAERNEKSEKAKKSAEARWNRQKNANASENNANASYNDANAMHSECDSNAIKEKKEKESKEKEIKEEVSKSSSQNKVSEVEIFLPKISTTPTLEVPVVSAEEKKQTTSPRIPPAPPPDIGDGKLHAMCRQYNKENKNKYPPALYIDFLNYWTAIVQNGKKKDIGLERWRVEITFNIASRLSTWYSKNPNQYQKNGSKQSGLNTPKNLGATAVFSDDKDYSKR